MTAKEYLSQAYRIEQRINSKLEQVSRLRSLSRRATSEYGEVAVSRTRNMHGMEDALIRLMEAERCLNREIDCLVDTKRDIQQTIDLLSDADCRMLLELRYLCMKRWEDIAGDMGICRAYGFTLHRKALELTDTVLRTRRACAHEHETN